MRGKTSSNSNSHRGVNIEQDSTQVSYLISIKIHQPKIRIKIPKLIVKTMRFNPTETNNKNTSVDCAESPKTTLFSKPRKLLLSTTKVGSIFTSVFHNKKHQQPQPPEGSSSNNKCLDCGNIPAKYSRENSGSLKKKRSNNAPTMAGKLTQKVLLPGSKKRVEVEEPMVIGKQESSGKLVRVVSSTVVQTRRNKLRKFNKKDLEKGKDGDVELCKKRILMGGKCKPLNISGTLHYDNNGILLPDE